MRIRYLKPEFFKDEHIKDLPFEVRLFYQGLWIMADRSGRLEDRPERLKAEIMPYDKIDVNKLLDLLAKPKNDTYRPFIIRYKVDGEKYIQIIKWDKHQKPHHTEKPSSIPPAPPLNTKENGNGKCSSPELEERNSIATVRERLKNGITPKTLFLEFVYLTDQEYKKLIELYGIERIKDLIDRLNNYVGSTGKKYNSHYHTILNWIRRDNPAPLPKRRIL